MHNLFFSFFFFLACVCCDLFLCEKVKDLFDKSFIGVTELSMHLHAYRYVSSVLVLYFFLKGEF